MSPFSGKTIATCDDPTIEILRDVLVFCVDFLRPRFPTILLNHDWHEHDGFINPSEPTSWEQLSENLATPGNLFNSRDDDTYVRIAIFPTSYEWLLRYKIEGDDERWCDFDFSAQPNSEAAPLLDKISDTWPGYVDVSDSKTFFDSLYGG